MLTLSHHSLAIEKIHFLIPNDAGGGQDSTARSTGEALLRSGLISRASYENMSGGDGSKAISHLIETAERQTNTLMITSTPIILRSLKNIFPQSYKDLTAISTVVADFGAFVVRADSKYVSWRQVVEDVEQVVVQTSAGIHEVHSVGLDSLSGACPLADLGGPRGCRLGSAQ